MGMCNRWGSDATLPLAGPKQAPVMGSQGMPGPQLHVGTSTAENTQYIVKTKSIVQFKRSFLVSRAKKK